MTRPDTITDALDTILVGHQLRSTHDTLLHYIEWLEAVVDAASVVAIRAHYPDLDNTLANLEGSEK